MAVSSPGMAASMLAALSSRGVSGPYAPGVAQAVAAAVVPYITTLSLVTSDVGASGAATSVVPASLCAPSLGAVPTLAPLLQSAMLGTQVAGTYAPALAEAVAQGFCQHMVGVGVVSVQHVGVGAGVGIGGFQNNGTLPALLSQALAAHGLAGSHAAPLAQAIAAALASFIASVVVTVSIVGVAGPVSGTGVGVGRVS